MSEKEREAEEQKPPAAYVVHRPDPRNIYIHESEPEASRRTRLRYWFDIMPPDIRVRLG